MEYFKNDRGKMVCAFSFIPTAQVTLRIIIQRTGCFYAHHLASPSATARDVLTSNAPKQAPPN